MAKTRAPYAVEFREQMVELVASGRRPQELVREFGCCAQTIHDWIKKAGRVIDLPRGTQIVQVSKQAPAIANATALSTQGREELQRLRKEVRPVTICWVPCDHVPVRSWPLFRARQLMRDVIESFKQDQAL